MTSDDQAVGNSVAHFLISDWCERVQPIVGGAIPGLVALGSIRKQSEQAMRRKSVSSTPSMTSASAPVSRFLPCLSSCPDFLWWWTVMWKCKPNKPFPLQLAFGHGLCSNSNPETNRLSRKCLSHKTELSLSLYMVPSIMLGCTKPLPHTPDAQQLLVLSF